jgi:hypothetical protein
LRAATGAISLFPRRFAVVLVSFALAGVGGGGGLVESTEEMYIPVLSRLKLGLGFPKPVTRPGFVFLGGGSSERRHGCSEVGSNLYVGFPVLAGGDRTGSGPCGVRLVEATSSVRNNLRLLLLHLVGLLFGSGDGLGGCYLARSRVSFEAFDLVGEVFCYSLGFFFTVAQFGEVPGSFIYHYSEKSGWWFTCNWVGEFVPHSVDSSSVDLELPDTDGDSHFPRRWDGQWSSSVAWAFNGSTACSFDMLLVVPIQKFSSSGRALASSCNLGAQWMLVEGLLRLPATKMTGTLQDPCMDYNVNSFWFRGACISYHVNLVLII